MLFRDCHSARWPVLRSSVVPYELWAHAGYPVLANDELADLHISDEFAPRDMLVEQAPALPGNHRTCPARRQRHLTIND